MLSKYIAKAMFLGVKDQSGQPYFNHLQRVANLAPKRLRDVAYLHDLLEDTKFPEFLVRLLFGKRSLEIIKIVSKKKGESYADFIIRISRDKDATIVKIADLTDNLRPSTVNIKRRGIYKESLKFLKGGKK